MSRPVDIRALVPHAGDMCLLDELLSWDGEGAALLARSHRSRDNPLRRHGRLSAICLCEYGAQAMAVHGALVAREAGRSLAPGFLVSLRDVELAVASVESVGGALRVEVTRLAGGEAWLQYRFRVTHDGDELARGRAAIIESRA